ncbi:hypothetical protein CGZ80_04645 [Rhodopirellula sp. MGV]|nr:hypothetical protein CGZ80_04645 [Rhodopirellula sp. MGV]
MLKIRSIDFGEWIFNKIHYGLAGADTKCLLLRHRRHLVDGAVVPGRVCDTAVLLHVGGQLRFADAIGRKQRCDLIRVRVLLVM